MGEILYPVLVGVVLITMFTVLVAAHELGHYLFARMFNMGVEEFAIGFGKLGVKNRPPFWTYMKRTYRVPMLPGQVSSIEHEEGAKFDLEGAGSRPIEDVSIIDTPNGQILEEVTRFTIRPWPFGGFVRIKGMLPEDDGSETKIAGGFYSKPPWQRLLVLFAGPLFSVLAGIAILVPVKMVDGGIVNKPILGHVAPDSAAQRAGMVDGDEIVSIDGQPVSTFYGVVQIVRNSENKMLHLVVNRHGKQLQIDVTPELEKEPSPILQPDLTLSDEDGEKRQVKLGASPSVGPLPLSEAFHEAIQTPVIAVKGLFGAVRHPAKIKDSVGGPITITRFTYATVKFGFGAILELAALLSISVGIFNLLPWAPLDGGQMTMAFAEMLRGGRRLSIRVQGIINGVGLMLMCVLILGVFFIDIGRLFGKDDPLKSPPPKKSSTK